MSAFLIFDSFALFSTEFFFVVLVLVIIIYNIHSKFKQFKTVAKFQ